MSSNPPTKMLPTICITLKNDCNRAYSSKESRPKPADLLNFSIKKGSTGR